MLFSDEKSPEDVVVSKDRPLLLQLQFSMQPRQITQPGDQKKTKSKQNRQHLRMRNAFSSSTKELITIDVVKIMHQMPTESSVHRQHLAREIWRTMWNK